MSSEPLPVLEAIAVRHSVRNFQGQLPPEKLSVVAQAVTEALALRRPFGTDVDIENHAPGLGRLGVVSNEAGWLMGKVRADVADSRLHFIDIGFVLHEVVIRLTQHGIATVWGGLFNASAAEASTPGFRVPIGVAYGERVAQPGLISRFFSWMSGSGARLPFEQLFWDGVNGRAFTEETAGEWGNLLKAVQSGPSAINKQPWRLVIVGNAVHVYNVGTQSYTLFDIGIALAGIELYAGSAGKAAEFVVVTEPPAQPLGGIYVITVRLN